MTDPKKIISCSHCKKQIRIPADKHIRFSCPECGAEFEFKNGEEVIQPDEKVYVEEPKFTKATVIKSAAKKKTDENKLLIFILLFFLACAVIFWINNSSHKKVENYYTTTDATQSPTTDTLRNLSVTQPIEPTIYHGEKDSLFNENLKEFAKELGHHLLDALVDEIKEESEKGEWEKANDWYEQTTEVMKQSGKKGEDLMKKYVDKLAKLKSEIISQNPDKGTLPSSEQTDNNEIEQDVASEQITNQTPYTLTLYYTGPGSKIETILPYGTKEILLIKGIYHIVAQASAPGIIPYYGIQTYRGVHYANKYILETQ